MLVIATDILARPKDEPPPPFAVIFQPTVIVKMVFVPADMRS